MISRRKLALWGVLTVAGLGAITPSSDGVYFCGPCSTEISVKDDPMLISLWNDQEQLCLSGVKRPVKKAEVQGHAMDL